MSRKSHALKRRSSRLLKKNFDNFNEIACECACEIRNKILSSFQPSWRSLARAGIQEIQRKLDYRFRGNDEREEPTDSVTF